MRRLMLLRHAKTEGHAPSGEDIDRRLDERGRNDAVVIGEWMAGQRHRPRRVLVSTAVRARQTWDMAGPLLDRAVPDVVYLPELYLAEPAELLHTIRSNSANATPLLLIGHNPGLHELALMLAGEGTADARYALSNNLPTSGLAVIDFDITDWGDVAFQRGRLMQFVSPKLLRQTSDDA